MSDKCSGCGYYKTACQCRKDDNYCGQCGRVISDCRCGSSHQDHWSYDNRNLDTFDNARGKYFSDYKKYYEYNKEVTEEIKQSKKIKEGYNDGEDYSDYYITCIPWLSFLSMSHPIPDNNIPSSSVPRICWDKYQEENNSYVLTLNINVSHALVDGKSLSDAFNKVSEYASNFENTIRE